MARDTKNKVVAITGGAEGIGYEIAKNFAKKQSRVVILDFNEKLGIEATKKLTTEYGVDAASFIKCDVTKDLEAVSKQLFDQYKNIDVFVNNAGILNEMDLKKTIEVNVMALMKWTMKFWEHMRTDKGGNGGVILNLASIYGFRTDQYVPFYNASKFAVIGFTKSLGHEYNFKRFGVRVVALCPGFTETRLACDLPKIPDPQTHQDFIVFLKGVLWQKADVVGEAAVKVFERADSGTAWLIEGARPVEQVD